MFIDMVIFAIMAKLYKYVKVADDEDDDNIILNSNGIALKEANEHENPNFNKTED